MPSLKMIIWRKFLFTNSYALKGNRKNIQKKILDVSESIFGYIDGCCLRWDQQFLWDEFTSMFHRVEVMNSLNC